MRLSFRTAGRIAWRETRSSLAKFLFVVLAVAAGVGALSGVRGFSESFHSMLTKEARTVMAADLTARQFTMPNDRQIAALDALAARGVEHTWITETVSMASGTSNQMRLPCWRRSRRSIPTRYPYYGTVQLQPRDAAHVSADRGYRGCGRRPAHSAEYEAGRYGAHRRKELPRGCHHRIGARPHVVQPEHRPAADDVARGLRQHRADATGQPRE